MTKATRNRTHGTSRLIQATTSIIVPFLFVLAITPTAHANSVNGGIIDDVNFLETKPAGNGQNQQREQAAKNKLNQKALTKQVKKEQQALAKLSQNAVKKLAEKGERLAQVELANEFAAEAQLLTFAPAAANAALSDALKWYSLAAKRGFPGSPALDTSGVSVNPIRVVRNR